MRNKRFHKLMAAVCALVLLLVLAACGGDQPGSPAAPIPGVPSDPAPSQSAQPETPMTLGEYIQSDGLHIMYYGDIAKDASVSVFVFEDGKLAKATQKKTLGDLAKMTDEEIAAEIYADPDTELDCPYYTYVRTDSTGNRVEEEKLVYCVSIGSRSLGTINLEHTACTGVVYESTYSGFRYSSDKLITRGESYILDGIDSEYVSVDPSIDEIKALEQELGIPQAARAKLLDDTIVDAPEDGGKWRLAPMSGSKTLNISDVQFFADGVDVSPATPFYQAAGETGWGLDEGKWETYFLIDNGDPDFLASTMGFGPDGWAELTVGKASIVYDLVNMTSEDALLSDMNPIYIGYYLTNCEFTTTAGPLNGYEDLLALYGDPSGALLTWNDRRDQVDTAYYWQGDGFIILCAVDKPSLQYIDIAHPDLAIYTEDYGLMRLERLHFLAENLH